ncbi:MAG: hypothetical protein JW751_12940 [Polyangiaceae bacterium]|nr:hypothetical protein [Polyangiaceae bacterium]
MDSKLLIDSIVQQTTVLIAQLSTTAGARSPLAHVADRVFVDLVSELERQRVGKKVIADVFGLALRSYQQKVQRLGESATDRGVTLWAAVANFVAERRVVNCCRRARALPGLRVPGCGGRAETGVVSRGGALSGGVVSSANRSWARIHVPEPVTVAIR